MPSAADLAAIAPPPPTPPTPPTDPTAIGVLSVLQNICIPAANGGDLVKLAKSAGYKKTGDGDWQLRQHDFTLVVADPGSNPTQCHVAVMHPVDAEAPGRAIVVALHDWATYGKWSLYRNDKSVQGDLQYTTRSWQRDADGKSESLVFTTHRHPDGTPMQSSQDASELIYAESKDAS
jgi:hypothetical protein